MRFTTARGQIYHNLQTDSPCCYSVANVTAGGCRIHSSALRESLRFASYLPAILWPSGAVSRLCVCVCVSVSVSSDDIYRTKARPFTNKKVAAVTVVTARIAAEHRSFSHTRHSIYMMIINK